jgi:hypothetical protein
MHRDLVELYGTKMLQLAAVILSEERAGKMQRIPKRDVSSAIRDAVNRGRLHSERIDPSVREAVGIESATQDPPPP